MSLTALKSVSAFSLSKYQKMKESKAIFVVGTQEFKFPAKKASPRNIGAGSPAAIEYLLCYFKFAYSIGLSPYKFVRDSGTTFRVKSSVIRRVSPRWFNNLVSFSRTFLCCAHWFCYTGVDSHLARDHHLPVCDIVFCVSFRPHGRSS